MNTAAQITDTDDKRILETGLNVLQAEIDGLQALQNSLDHHFVRAVNTIHNMKSDRSGRLIVAGIGKSGHISKKIAATLASTGTPSFFVHPGEASHGDLGMVTDHDIVLMISNSGENQELSDLIAYTRRNGITMIAITGNPESTLAQHADILLCLPKMPEAQPNGMAPTTSTTMTLAMGDALTIALLDKMDLSPEQYKVFHPGGKLGQRLMKISEIMHKEDDLPLVRETDTMDQAILMLSEKNLGCALVIDSDRQLLGIITDGDLKRHMSPDLLKKPVTDIMSTSPKTISQTALAAEAVQSMTQTPDHYITSLIAVDEKGNLSGLIRLQDCLQAGVA